ncbi:MAG: DUF4214 domain-containing protein [Tenuifilaceae bacterium]|nr:DUF4214 domain-containing protein [Tenuifilaceae bacterium]
MTASKTQQQIIELYIATFNRAPDADGLAYWVSTIESSGWSLRQVSDSMFESAEVALNYPETLSNAEFLNQVYLNVLGRAGDGAGIDYWLAQMATGIQRSQMIITIINGAKAASGDPIDRQFLQNKKEAGIYFSVELGLNDLALAQASMDGITSDLATVQPSKDRQDLAVAIAEAKLDIILGDETNNILKGNALDNFIYGDAGDDTILAMQGNNTIVAGDGIDTIQTGSGNDIIKGGNGDDTIYAGDGDDIIYGNSGNDSLHGEGGNDTIYGGDGDDYIYGGAGDDLLYGGAGNDNIHGGTGNDTIYGGDGDDYIYVTDGVNFIYGGDGNDVIYGGSGKDTIYGGAGDDTIYGGDGDDILDGLTGDDIIYGGAGNDQINGNEGNDILYGGSGNDMIDGEMGDDTIYGGLGADILVGGEGRDNFVFETQDSNFTTMDIILDFTYTAAGYDTIALIAQGSEIINSQKSSVSSATTLQEAADIASQNDGSTDAIVSWFIYDHNTYIVQDLSDLPTFDETTDVIIKLQGTLDLTGLNQNTILFS